MGTKTLMSLKEYELLPGEGVRHELDEGELITMPGPKLRHSVIAMIIGTALRTYVVAQRLGLVLIEASFLLCAEPITLRQPDVAFVRADRIRAADLDGYVEGAPDLAIEIVSPSDSMADIDRKVEQYLAAGSTLVWVVIPKHERIRIFRADGTSTVRHRGEILDAAELFPGWSMPVEQVFA
jgi:Uma2 family endonuclease